MENKPAALVRGWEVAGLAAAEMKWHTRMESASFGPQMHEGPRGILPTGLAAKNEPFNQRGPHTEIRHRHDYSYEEL